MNLWSFDEFFIRSTFFRRIHSSIALSFGNSLISRGENYFGIFGIFAEAKIFFLFFVALFSRERRISVDFQWIASGFPRFQFPKFRISNFYKITPIYTYIYIYMVSYLNRIQALEYFILIFRVLYFIETRSILYYDAELNRFSIHKQISSY